MPKPDLPDSDDAQYRVSFKNLVENSMVGIYVLQDGRVKYCNPRLAEIYGYSREEILEWDDVMKAVAPEEREMVARYLEQRFSGEVPSIHYTLTIVRKDGGRRILDVFGNRIIFRGRPAVVGSLIDQTEQKTAETALQESESRFRTIFESSAFGIVMTDLRTKQIVKTNPAFQEMLGYSEAELRELGVAGITHPEDQGITQRVVSTLLAGKTKRNEFEKRYCRKDGTTLWARVVTTIAEQAEGAPSLVVSLIEDVTEIKEAREEIEQLLTREKKARIEAQDALRLRDEFVSVASHELLTPLTPLELGFALFGRWLHAPASASERPSREEILRLFESLKQQLQRLKGIASDLLDASLMQSGGLAMRRQDSDLLEITNSVIQEFKSALESAECRLEFTHAGATRGFWDSNRLRQVVGSLLSNAIKFGAKHPIRIELSGGEREVIFKIADQGVGVEEQERHRIFDRFARAASVRHYGGLGLGLYLASEIVKAHGGEIDVESHPGKGAVFTVRLPR